MNNDQIAWTLITTYLASYYDTANVFLGYQNYYVADVANDFVIISNLLARQKYTPNREYNSITQEKILQGYNDIDYQIDMYGANAATASDTLYTILGSVVGSNFLRQYNSGIGRVEDVKNLTGVNDRDNYMPRYMLKFSLLANNNITVPMGGIGLEDVTINLKEYT